MKKGQPDYSRAPENKPVIRRGLGIHVELPERVLETVIEESQVEVVFSEVTPAIDSLNLTITTYVSEVES